MRLIHEGNLTAIEKSESEKRLADLKKEQENRIALAEQTSQILGSVINIVGKQTAAGKAFAIAQATVDTYAAANKALNANYGLFGPVAQIARFISVASTIALGISKRSSAWL